MPPAALPGGQLLKSWANILIERPSVLHVSNQYPSLGLHGVQIQAPIPNLFVPLFKSGPPEAHHKHIKMSLKNTFVPVMLQRPQMLRFQPHFAGQGFFDQLQGLAFFLGQFGPDRQVVGGVVGVEQAVGQVGG